MLGLPVLRERGLHVAVVRTASRLRDSMDRSVRLGRGAGVRVHWRDCGIGDRLVRETLAVLVDMSTCQAPEVTIAAVDAALREGLITIAAWMHAVSQLPRKLRALLAQVDGLAESIIESLTRVRLRGLGIHAQLQVRIPGVGRIDLLVGTRLVIEVDGRRFHETEEAFERDRDRDARLSIRGYRVLRFTYKQVTERWSQVKAAILAAMARGDHLA